jgi:hypothetical protein
VLKHNQITYRLWSKCAGYIYQVGDSAIHFLSGSPAANIVGATASLLLECDEAQDVSIEKWDKEIAPMAASTNATRVFWGTAWTSQTLLARELRVARRLEQEDGIQRSWVLTADEVGEEVPAYRKFIDEQVQRLGRQNPLVRTQYFSEEIDAEGGMFPTCRLLLMTGAHPSLQAPVPGQVYAFTIDVAGQDEGVHTRVFSEGAAGLTAGGMSMLSTLENPQRDSTVLTIFQVDASGIADPLLGKPTYRVVGRLAWQGVKHSTLYGTLLGLVDAWQPMRVIIDATGIGAGLAGFLADKLGSRLIPFEFTQASKSDLGWDFITVIETGRYKEYYPLDVEMRRQLEHCQYSILDGPGKVMRWGVPDACREAGSGELVHDDYVVSAALVSVLGHEKWGTAESQVLPAADILEGMRF